MSSHFISPQKYLFDFKHLLLADLNSSGLFFYLAKEVKDLSSIDFSNLTFLKGIFSNDFCKSNLISDDELLKKTIDTQLKSFDLDKYCFVFLISPEITHLEKEVLKNMLPFLKKTIFVERHYFYNFYLMQKRNFSKAKYIISFFDDCAELCLFHQDKLLDYQKVSLRNLAIESKQFIKKTKDNFRFEFPDCLYLFTNNSLIEKEKITDLSKYLKMEAVEVKNLC